MRVRTGIDLVNIAQLAQYVQDEALLDEAWTPAERTYAMNRPERLAAQWAAKEAVMKVLEEGLGRLSLQDVEVASVPGHPPTIVLHGPARKVSDDAGITDLSVSITHEGEWAAAVAVALIEEGQP